MLIEYITSARDINWSNDHDVIVILCSELTEYIYELFEYSNINRAHDIKYYIYKSKFNKIEIYDGVTHDLLDANIITKSSDISDIINKIYEAPFVDYDDIDDTTNNGAFDTIVDTIDDKYIELNDDLSEYVEN